LARKFAGFFIGKVTTSTATGAISENNLTKDADDSNAEIMKSMDLCAN
jgi:hypothetical protein